VEENEQVPAPAAYYVDGRPDVDYSDNEQFDSEVENERTSTTRSSYSYDYDPTYDSEYDSEYDENRNNDDDDSGGSESSTSYSSTRDSSSQSVNMSGNHHLSAKQLRYKLRQLGPPLHRRDEVDEEEEDSDEGRRRASRRHHHEETEESSSEESSPERPRRHRRHHRGHRRQRRRRRRSSDNYNTSAMSDTSKTQTTTTSTTTTREGGGGAGGGDATSTGDSEAAGTGVKSHFVKIIAVAVVKPNGKYDILDVEIHPWKPAKAWRNAGRSRLKPRTWTDAVSSHHLASGAAVASGSKAVGQGGRESPSNFSQNNSNSRDDGQSNGVYSASLCQA